MGRNQRNEKCPRMPELPDHENTSLVVQYGERKRNENVNHIKDKNENIGAWKQCAAQPVEDPNLKILDTIS